MECDYLDSRDERKTSQALVQYFSALQLKIVQSFAAIWSLPPPPFKEISELYDAVWGNGWRENLRNR